MDVAIVGVEPPMQDVSSSVQAEQPHHRDRATGFAEAVRGRVGSVNAANDPIADGGLVNTPAARSSTRGSCLPHNLDDIVT